MSTDKQSGMTVYPCTYRELSVTNQKEIFDVGISLYLQGTLQKMLMILSQLPVYPCTYRELWSVRSIGWRTSGISLYLQGTPCPLDLIWAIWRYIPVPTGNSCQKDIFNLLITVYPCTYRELYLFVYSAQFAHGISLYLQGTRELSWAMVKLLRYIPVPTGNSNCSLDKFWLATVYPCTYRELRQLSPT